MKLTSLAFVLLLVLAHLAGDPERAAALPLSMFRDGDCAWLGYALFGHLLLIGGMYTLALARSDKIAEAVISGVAVLLLLIVAVTPSLSGYHHGCSLLLLLLLFSYYGVVLYHAGSKWLVAHLGAPLILAFFIGFHSYGLWQKMFIVYIVGAAVAHHHLSLRRNNPERSRFTREGRRGYPTRRRKVYRLEPGRAWGQISATSSSVV